MTRSHDFCLWLGDNILNVSSYHTHLKYFQKDIYTATEHKLWSLTGGKWMGPSSIWRQFLALSSGRMPPLQQGDSTASRKRAGVAEGDYGVWSEEQCSGEEGGVDRALLSDSLNWASTCLQVSWGTPCGEVVVNNSQRPQRAEIWELLKYFIFRVERSHQMQCLSRPK